MYSIFQGLLNGLQGYVHTTGTSGSNLIFYFTCDSHMVCFVYVLVMTA